MDDESPIPAPDDGVAPEPRRPRPTEPPPGLEGARRDVLRDGGITSEGKDPIFYPIKPPVLIPIENPVRRDYDTGEVIP